MKNGVRTLEIAYNKLKRIIAESMPAEKSGAIAELALVHRCNGSAPPPQDGSNGFRALPRDAPTWCELLRTHQVEACCTISDLGALRCCQRERAAVPYNRPTLIQLEHF
jgi:hypothetical protein